LNSEEADVGDEARMTTVAIVGTGRMGGSMARAIAAAGLPLVLQNRTRERAEPIASELGARLATSPAEAASLADVTITMLGDDAAVEATFIGPDGLVDGARPGVVLVDSSTTRPETIRSLEAAVRATGAGLLDAPVSGSVGLAASGQLTLMVGGEAADLERARPGLEPLARTIFHLGPLGSGAAMKLAVNTVVFGLNGALAEALVLAESAGVDLGRAYDVLTASAVGAPFVAYKRDAFLAPDTTAPAFALALAEKDLGLILGVARSSGVPMPQSETNVALVRQAAEGGRGERDFTTVVSELRDRWHEGR
jgi:3-hydroxyisobutyrate dehydrogenase/2-hydroxy-3-oxopropionate reductase